MKTETLNFLLGKLVVLTCDIRDYERSLEVGKLRNFSADKLATLRERLSVMNEEKRKIKECIAWVKSIEKKDIKSK